MKQLMTYRPFLIASLVMFAVLGAFGQETWEKEGEGEIKDLEIELTKERQLTLPRANRYFEKVPPRAFEPIVPAITYDVRSFSFKSPNFIPAIRPLRVKQEELARGQRDFFSCGSPYVFRDDGSRAGQMGGSAGVGGLLGVTGTASAVAPH